MISFSDIQNTLISKFLNSNLEILSFLRFASHKTDFKKIIRKEMWKDIYYKYALKNNPQLRKL